VEAVVTAYGARPVVVLADAGLPGGQRTVVHATHLEDHEVALLGGAAVTVCAGPTTERDLGDGFLRARDLLDAGARICLGLVAPPLLRMATQAGAASLGLRAGAIESGALADLITIDLEHPSVAGWHDDTLAATLVLSATPDVVSDVWVVGVRRLHTRRHAAEADIQATFQAVARSRPAV
jgi:formimidoylglutamate deiminase